MREMDTNKGILHKLVFKLFPRKIYALIKKLRLGYLLVYSKESYLVQSGYVHSVMNYSTTDRQNLAIPWMNFPFIEFLKERLTDDLLVFEYGSGSSTVFFAERTRKVISIEYDKDWFNILRKKLIKDVENANVWFVSLDQDYPYAIKKYTGEKTCDIIVIDGRMRVECARIVFPYLSERGVVIFDDSHRQEYIAGLEFLEEKGFKSLSFKGIKPTGLGTMQTTVFYRNNNCLNL